jgi:integrase/recombinase XerD
MNFTHYLQSLNLSVATINKYSKEILFFLQWYQDEAYRAEKKDVLAYMAHLKKNTKQQAKTRSARLLIIRHYFNYLIHEKIIDKNPASLIKIRGTKTKKLLYMYSSQELEELLDKYYQLEVKPLKDKLTKPTSQFMLYRSYCAKIRNYTLLTFIIHQGLTTKEILNIQLQDIELQKASIYIPSGTTRGKARNLPLHATQIGTLMQYTEQIRPQMNPINNILFVPLPKKDPKAKKEAQAGFKQLVKRLKAIDKNFASLMQIRMSVITYWVKLHGLRKTQYLAGHKNINSTEEYLPNYIQDLQDDITKYNPF